MGAAGQCFAHCSLCCPPMMQLDIIDSRTSVTIVLEHGRPFSTCFVAIRAFLCLISHVFFSSPFCDIVLASYKLPLYQTTSSPSLLSSHQRPSPLIIPVSTPFIRKSSGLQLSMTFQEQGVLRVLRVFRSAIA